MPDGYACPRCGTVPMPGERFCSRCGYDLAAPRRAPTAEESRRRAVELSMGRNVSDEIMSPLWILVPLLAIVAAITVGIVLVFIDPSFGGFVAVVGSIAAVALFIYLNYKLIDRMNKHMAREAALRRALIEHVWARGQERGTAAAVQPYVSAMESIDQGARITDVPRSTLWSLAILIPIVGIVLYFYMLYFLSKFAFEHDDRWHAFAYNVHLASAANGDNVPPPIPRFPQDRSFLLYLVITIIFSPFLIYWYLKLIEDTNTHFREQWAFEDGFRAAAEGTR
ncbi:hypothetical protein AOA80_04030 [Methanomassiliicoccales archaeon RumEn M1]|nr:hypothetical protein AOA80_04030 [Methanomassiliicoccales archaeon RumEn M1]